MSEWKEYTIGEICSRFSSGKSIKASQISAEGLYPVYGGNGLRGFTDTFNFDGECSIIGRQGAYCGNVRYFKGKAFMTEHAIVAVVNENHNNGYVSNLLSMMNLAQYQGQSAQPGLSVSTLSKITIKLPDLATQEQCFNVLNLIDQKIQINNQINRELESMAKTLYDYWFVQFDFPDQNGKPYKSSGGKMVYNPELKREIPEGWGVEKIENIAQTGSGGTPKSTNVSYYSNGEIPWINSGELEQTVITSTSNFITEEGLNNSSAKLFPSGTILVAMYGATAGKVSFLTFEASTNQAICAITLTDIRMRYYLKNVIEDLYQYLVKLSTGSARDNLSQDMIKNIKVYCIHC